MMNKGKLLQYSSVDNIYNSPASTFVGYFIGDPGMNFMTCRLEGRILNCGNFTYDRSKKNLDGHGTHFQIGIRPEHVEVSRNKKGNWIPANLAAVENLGTMKILHLESGQHKIKAKMKAWDDSEDGTVWVCFPDDHIKIFDSSGGLVVS
jgi:glycerol transport system ATP-binding protein